MYLKLAIGFVAFAVVVMLTIYFDFFGLGNGAYFLAMGIMGAVGLGMVAMTLIHLVIETARGIKSLRGQSLREAWAALLKRLASSAPRPPVPERTQEDKDSEKFVGTLVVIAFLVGAVVLYLIN